MALADLLQAADETGFETTRVAYRVDDAWTELPRRVSLGARQIKVSGYHNHHTEMVTLIDGVSHERLQVLVVSPQTPAPLAKRVFRIVAEHVDPTHGADVLALARNEMHAATVIS